MTVYLHCFHQYSVIQIEYRGDELPMSEIKYVFAAAAFSALMLFAGCSGKKSESSEPNMVEYIVTDGDSVPVLSLTKAETTTTTMPLITNGVTVSVQPTVSATVYVVNTDYETFEAVGFGSEAGKTHSSKPVSKGDLFVSASDIGVMDGYELEWTGDNPWSEINIMDSNGIYYEYTQKDGKDIAINPITGEEFSFDIVTSGSVISGFAVYGLPDAEYYTITVTGSAKVVGSDYPCTWNAFVTYVYPQ